MKSSFESGKRQLDAGEPKEQAPSKKRNENYYGPGGGEQQWGKAEEVNEDEGANDEPKVKPNFGLTGALAKDEVTGNTVNGVVMKWTEPLDAAKPNSRWRFYVFKDDAVVETLHLHRQSVYLAGRDTRVADIILAHPSCSKQHAVVQFRKVEKRLRDGSSAEVILPYLMDLASVHHTLLNGAEVEDSRYYELRAKDCVKFGGSTREYILMLDDGDTEDK